MHEPPSDNSSQEQHIKDSSIEESQLQTGQNEESGSVNQLQGSGIIININNSKNSSVTLPISTEQKPESSTNITVVQSPSSKRFEPDKHRQKFTLRSFGIIVLASLLSTSLIMLMRWQGKLQTWELKAFDQLMRWQPVGEEDPRLLVIRVTPEDIEKLNQPPEETGQGARTLSDQTLNSLVQLLEKHNPSVIGLDLFREGSIEEQKYPDLETSLQQRRLVTACKASSEYDSNVIFAPTEAVQGGVGFVNVVLDEDGVIRRYLMLRGVSDQNVCRTKRVEAFSLRIALIYLEKSGITRQDKPEDEFLKIGNVNFPYLELHRGGYHQATSEVDRAYQVMLNYRSYRDHEDIAKSVTLTQVLNGDLVSEDVRDKIILIGVDYPYKDRHKTPHTKTGEFSQELSGVFIQAQMISQVLDMAMGKRSLIWTWHWLQDTIWIWIWSLLGSTIVQSFSLKRLSNLEFLLICVSFVGFLFIVQYSLCWFFMGQGGWLPLLPTSFSIILSGSGITVYGILKRKVTNN